MKIPCLLFFLFLGYSLAIAQTNLDSLYGIWEDKTQADSSRIFAFRDYIRDGYLHSKPDSAKVLADRLFKFSTNTTFKKGNAAVLNIQGEIYKVQGNNFKARSHYQRSLEISKEIGDKNGIAASLDNIGIIYRHQGEFVKALEYFQKSLKINEEIGNKKGIASFLNSIGIIYYTQSEYEKALKYYQKSLKIREEIGDQNDIAASFNNIGIIYRNQGEYVKALQYYQKSLKIKEEIGDKKGRATSLNNIGNIYRDQGKYQQALEYFQKSLKIKEEIGDKKGQAISLYNIGDVYQNQGNNLKAIANCKKGLEFAIEIGSIEWQNDLCYCLYNAHKAQGNGNKALEYHEQMTALADSLQTEETATKLQQIEFSKQVLADSLLQVDKDRRVEMANLAEGRKKDKNRNIAIGAGIFFLFLSAGLFSRWNYVKKSKAIIEKEKDRSDNLLLNILPAEIAEELKLKGSADARDFDLVSILFTDFESFTETSEKLTAKELIGEINHCFEAFDHICEKFGIEKIKTIGDSFMAAGGLPIPSEDSVKNTVLAALAMQSFISERILEKRAKNETPFEMRLGINTGPVVAGIVGVKKFQYDIWGDTVNTASRLESSGEIGKVNISQDTYEFIKDDPQFHFEARGKIEAKGKGEMAMYFVTKAS